MAGRPITPQQELFAQEYVKTLNGTQAAIAAGYSERSASAQASDLLNRPNVKARIIELKDRVREANAVTAQRVIDELAKVALSNIKHYVDAGNEVKDLSEIPDEHGAVVSSIKVTKKTYEGENGSSTEKTVAFKLWDKVAALDKLGRHFGIFEKDNEQSRPTEVVKFVLPTNGREKPIKNLRRG